MRMNTGNRTMYVRGLCRRAGAAAPHAEALEDRRLLASDLSIVESVSLAKGIFHETPLAAGTLAGGLFVDLNQAGQVSGMTLTTPNDVEFIVDDHDVIDGGEEWFLEDDDMSQADWNGLVDGIYILAIDLGAGGVHTIDILFAQDNNDPLLEVSQQPIPTNPSHGATGVDTQIDLSWMPVTDDNVNLIVVSLDEEPSGDIILDEFLDDTTMTSISNVDLSADSDYECEIVFASGIIREHAQFGFEIVVAKYVITEFAFTTSGAGDQLPDLVAEFETIGLPTASVPGDKFKVSVIVRNDGLGVAEGPFRVELYASDDQLFDQDDNLIVGKTLSRLRLQPGQSKKFVLKGQIPFDAEPSSSFLLAQADVNDGIAEDDETNNTAVSDDAFDVVYRFGSFNGRSNVKLTLQVDDDTTLQLKLTGAGFGQLMPDGDDAQLTFTGTDTGSSFKAILKGGSPQIRLTQVDITGGLKKFDAPFMDLAGDFSATGRVGMIKLGDVAPLLASGQVDISLGGAGVEAGGKFFFDEVRDASLTTPVPLKLLRMNGWQNTNGTADQITAPFATTVDSKGEFEANLTLSDSTVACSLKKLNATLWLKDNIIRTASSIGTVSTGLMDGVTLFAGIADGVVGLPDGPADFSSEATIKKLAVREPDGPTNSFENSFVAAYLLKSVKIGTVTTANGGTPFGFAAQEIKKFSGNGESFKKLTTPGDYGQDGDFLLRVV
jgi:CARDB